MKSVKAEFPNPVLAEERDDYIDECFFRTEIVDDKVTVDSENINVTVKYELKCSYLNDLLKQGKVAIAIKVNSKAVSYGELFLFHKDEDKLTIKIPKYSVVDSIDLQGLIIAAEEIKGFTAGSEFNNIYFSGVSFNIRKGDILAYDASRTIYIDASELEKPIASIFSINRRNEQDHEFEASFEDEKIQIYLKDELFNLYCLFKDFNNGSLRRYSAGVVAYPVLVEAVGYVLSYYQNNGSGVDYSEKRWFRAIDGKIESRRIDVTETNLGAAAIANLLLGNIALDALKNFKDTLDTEVDNGETQGGDE